MIVFMSSSISQGNLNYQKLCSPKFRSTKIEEFELVPKFQVKPNNPNTFWAK